MKYGLVDEGTFIKLLNINPYISIYPIYIPVKPGVVYFGHWVKVPFFDLCMFLDVLLIRLIAKKNNI